MSTQPAWLNQGAVGTADGRPRGATDRHPGAVHLPPARPMGVCAGGGPWPGLAARWPELFHAWTLCWKDAKGHVGGDYSPALQPEHPSRPRHRAPPQICFYVTVVTFVGHWLSEAPDFIQSDRLPGSTPSALCVLLIPHPCPVTRLLSSRVQRGRSERFNDLPGATQLTSGFCPTPRLPDLQTGWDFRVPAAGPVPNQLLPPEASSGTNLRT